jgi:hypothetical protein
MHPISKQKSQNQHQHNMEAKTGWWTGTYTATFTLLSEALRSYISTQEMLNLDSETLIYNY